MSRLESFIDPYAGKSWGELGARVKSAGSQVRVELGYPAAGAQAELQLALAEHLGVDAVTLELSYAPSAAPRFGQVRHVIAVASGKGGVGKSTTAVNLALALDAEGAKVGLLDADIYGPSQGMMLGVADGKKPNVRDEKFFEPIKAHGLKTMSMSYLASAKTPMVWRGPMASGALQQMLLQTLWEDLDFLIVDMPPGTGDLQLTLSQRAPLAGAVIVTTPQDIALLDARKGIEMFRKVDVPVLGVLENMSYHECENCGHKTTPFGAGGGAQIAQELGVPLVGQLPLDLQIRLQADGGQPTVIAEPDGPLARAYRASARSVAAQLWSLSATRAGAPTITMTD